MSVVKLAGWSFIPGPVSNPPASSLNLQDVIEYRPEKIAAALLAFPGVRLLNAGEPTWWEWRAEWRRNDSVVAVGMSLFEPDDGSFSWGGSDIHGTCSLPEILGLWVAVRQSCPGVWMHNDDCEIYTPEGFARLHGA